MQKQLKSKISKMEKKQLIEIIEALCEEKETERFLKLLVSPTKSDVDKAIRKFENRVDIFVCNSLNGRDYDKMMDALDAIYAVIKFGDSKISAYTIYEVYQIVIENDLFEFECADFMYDLLEDLRYILEKDASVFTEEEIRRYYEALD